jgi:sugar phosphate permease
MNSNPFQTPKLVAPPEEVPVAAELVAAESASHARLIVLFFLCLLAGILYLDRISISKAIPSMQRDIPGLSDLQVTFVAMAFTLAYGIFEIPTGRWGDTIGARRILTRISLWWSLFTALTGACTGLWSLLVVRFLFGAGEAGGYPNAARVLSRWIPDYERGRAQGLMLTAGQFGGVIAPTIAAYLIEFVGWRWTFVVFGAIGVVWAAAFWLWFRDDPAEHPAVNAAELKLIRQSTRPKPIHHEPIPWRLVAANPSIWLLGGIITCAAFNSYFYFTWYPKYLEEARGLQNVGAGWLTSLVLGGSAVGTLGGGFVADWILKHSRNPDGARRWFCSACFAVAAATLWIGVRLESPAAMSAMAAISCLAAFITTPAWWSCAIHVSGKHVGALFGLMNMMGVPGALASQFLVGAFIQYRGDSGFTGRDKWDPVFTVYVTVLAIAALGWLMYRSRVVEDDVEQASRLPA